MSSFTRTVYVMSTPTIARSANLVPEWTLTDRLRKAREHAGLEQLDLAQTAGISRAAISAAENGRNVPHRSTLMLWALATGVSVEWLETGEAPSEEGASDGARSKGLEPPTF